MGDILPQCSGAATEQKEFWILQSPNRSAKISSFNPPNVPAPTDVGIYVLQSRRRRYCRGKKERITTKSYNLSPSSSIAAPVRVHIDKTSTSSAPSPNSSSSSSSFWVLLPNKPPTHNHHLTSKRPPLTSTSPALNPPGKRPTNLPAPETPQT